MSDGNIDQVSKKVYDLDGITTVEFHVGNSDILGHVIYKDGKELLNIIVAIKKIDGVEKVVWSERIYQSPSKEADVVLKHLNNNSIAMNN